MYMKREAILSPAGRRHQNTGIARAIPKYCGTNRKVSSKQPYIWVQLFWLGPKSVRENPPGQRPLFLLGVCLSRVASKRRLRFNNAEGQGPSTGSDESGRRIIFEGNLKKYQCRSEAAASGRPQIFNFDAAGIPS